jgi:hypothetical protein
LIEILLIHLLNLPTPACLSHAFPRRRITDY